MGADKQIEAAKNEYKHHTRLQFPSDLGAYAMVFNFIDYSYTPAGYGLVTPKNNAITSETIVLPLPQNLEDITTVKSTNNDLGIIGAGAYELMNLDMRDARSRGATLEEALQGVLTNPSGVLSDTDTYLSSLQAFSKFAGRAALSSIDSGVGLAADLTTGTAVNPHTTLDFDGVGLKNHNFQWTLSPRNERESKSLNDIIKVIKRNMLPQYKSLAGGLAPRALLTYPKLVKVSLLGINQDYFYYYKPSMINNLNIQYTQGNGVSLLKGGRPAMVMLNIAMLEAEIHTAEDYPAAQSGKI